MAAEADPTSCSSPGGKALAAGESAAEVRKHFGLWLALALGVHALDQAARLSVVFALVLPGRRAAATLDSSPGDHLPLPWVELGLALGRLLAIVAGGRMAFRLVREQPAKRAEIPAASWAVVVGLQGVAIGGTVMHGAYLGIAHPLLGGVARAGSAAIIALGAATALCGEAARRRMERLRAKHQTLRSENRARRRADAAADARKMRFREGRGAPETTCAICLADFQHEDVVSELICGHLYHTECIRDWLAADARRVCPMSCSRSKNKIVEQWHNEHSVDLESSVLSV